MPDTTPIILPGNFYLTPEYSRSQSAKMGGSRVFEYEGYAEVNTTTGNSLVLRDNNDLPCVIPSPLDPIPLSATDPAYISHVSFYIPRVGEIQHFNGKPVTSPVTVGGTEVLKLAAAFNTDVTLTNAVGCASGTAAAGVLPSGVPLGEAISTQNPLAGGIFTATTELRLFSATSPLSGGAGSNIRVTSGRVLIPCRVIYSRRLRSPNMSSIQLSQSQRDIFDRLP